jgi:hypothetical protein
VTAPARPTASTQSPRFIPLRPQPGTADGQDTERAELVLQRWHGQDAAYIGYAKTVEEHVRMLSGRQWDVWSPMLGRFVDVLQWMNEDEKRWRQRPVMDFLGYWYQLTLSKATENQAVITFLPSTADRLDAMLAGVCDPIMKTVYDAGEYDVREARAAAWAIVAGEAYLMTRVDFTGGAPRQVIAPAVLTLERPDGTSIERIADAVPYDQEGNPLAQLVEDPDNPGEYGYDVTGEPYQDKEGDFEFDALCPLEVRAQWGSHIPWKKKAWVIHRWFLTPAEIERRWGVQCDADHYPEADDSGPGYLERMLFGTGYFGASMQNMAAQQADTSANKREGYVCGYTMWERPDPQHTPADREQHRAGGRLLIVTASKKVLWDSERPALFEAAGPIRKIGFVDIPGRPLSSTPLEKMVPLQKRLNRIEAQIAEHTNLCTNPVLLVHELAGIDDDEWVARPGTVITHGFMGQGQPALWLVPPPLSSDVWRHKADVREQLFTIGAMQGNQSAPPTADSSGELVEQLRFNADRPLSPLTHSIARARADVAEDVLALLPTVWTEEKVIAYAGKDNVVRTVTVLPEMFDGRVQVRPSLDSAAAESRTQRQQRVKELYALGVWGQPGSPQANAMLLDQLNYPNMERSARPGGVDRVMGETNVGRLVRRDPAAAIPLFDWYDFSVHLGVLDDFLKSPEYVELDEAVQHECVAYRELLQGAQMAQQIAAAKRTLAFQTATGAMQAKAAGDVAHIAQATHPAPPANGPDDATAGGGAPGAPSSGPHSPASPPRPDSRAA